MLNDKQILEIKADRIYRFRSPTDYNFKALLENKIFASTPNVLNDPLDCGITYNLHSLYKRLIKKKRFLDYFAYKLFKPDNEKQYDDFDDPNEYFEYSKMVIEECFIKMLDLNNRNAVEKAIDELSKSIIFELRDCFGIVSFSLVSGNSVMWSHYCSNFSGFVLGYDLKSFNDNTNRVVKSYYLTKNHQDFYGLHLVKYESLDMLTDGTDLMYELITKRITKKSEIGVKAMLDYALNCKHQDIFLSLLTTKDKSWEYEREIRLILPRENYRFNTFKISGNGNAPYFEVAEQYAPSEIIIGMNMSKINRAIIGYYVLQYPNVLLWEIKDDKMMSERSLYKSLVKPLELLK